VEVKQAWEGTLTTVIGLQFYYRFADVQNAVVVDNSVNNRKLLQLTMATPVNPLLTARRTTSIDHCSV
jgi:hypothetical protein